MKALPMKVTDKGYVPCTVEEVTHLQLRFPGPSGTIILPVITKGDRRGTPCWTWNGSVDLPTLKPSVRSSCGDRFICHSWVTDGQAQFLSDSTHSLAGQTLDLLDIEQ